VRYLLDTSFLIDYLNDHAPAVHRFDAFFQNGDQLFVNEIVVCELETGMRAAIRDAADALLEPLEFIQPGPETARMAGQWRRDILATGSTISVPDVLIAAAAFDSDAAVVTRNIREFSLTPARVEPY
jgi:predicted nucleic acid-binding protein